MHNIGHIAYACELICMYVEFRDEILLRGEECKTRENSHFLIKGKMVILIKNPKFFWILDDETNFTIGIVLRNLATSSNFVEFRGSHNFTFFKAPRWHETLGT